MPQITSQHKGDMLVETRVGNHTIVTDVPQDVGGKDRGPTPPQMFIASIASCISAVVAHYCKSAGLNADDMSVTVSFDKASDPARLTNLRATVRLPNCEPGKRESAIRKVAGNCPVYRSALETTSEMEINIE